MRVVAAATRASQRDAIQKQSLVNFVFTLRSCEPHLHEPTTSAMRPPYTHVPRTFRILPQPFGLVFTASAPEAD